MIWLNLAIGGDISVNIIVVFGSEFLNPVPTTVGMLRSDDANTTLLIVPHVNENPSSVAPSSSHFPHDGMLSSVFPRDCFCHFLCMVHQLIRIVSHIRNNFNVFSW